jgi:hypothetical protein
MAKCDGVDWALVAARVEDWDCPSDASSPSPRSRARQVKTKGRPGRKPQIKTDEEKELAEAKRRESNRLASFRSRKKRDARMVQLEEDNARLQKQNDLLRDLLRQAHGVFAEMGISMEFEWV